MKLQVVAQQIGGFAREDAPQMQVVAVLTDPVRAQALKRVVHGQVFEVEVDQIPQGYVDHAKQLGIEL